MPTCRGAVYLWGLNTVHRDVLVRNQSVRRLALGWGLLSVLFCVVAGWQSQRSLSLELSQQLQRQLPEKLALALQTRLNDEQLLQWVVQRLERDLDSFTAAGNLPLVRNCSVRVTQLMNDGRESAPGEAAGPIDVHWQIGNEPRTTSLLLDCGYNWPALILSQSLLALLLVIAAACLPRPLSKWQRNRIDELTGLGLPAAHARSLSTQLSDGQMPWFQRALHVNGGDLDAALAAARAEHRLAFDATSQQVHVHGVAIKLAKTPFFYYLWYAQLRQQGEGWLLNPPVNRPEREGAESLIALMEAHGGHAKSINDLRENGLRAKTLDQNRNKIRDELVSALGEELAATYLFESERDLKSGRYRYRLALGSESIEIATP
ncbi:hypothetical protein [Microbulbifer pacificus]|uniref:hypothetical protein n=1 Tax=Microbulbifer pacificus TaxID=407164 RepID=UPI001319EC39|nr:hypothetical protein [Microbulbifer pacificus]